ncbi:MAG: zinc ribbon domain-containing protein [Desulfamplus sp.]|nr:zinc ribbon domain-containing protein [Desulfamplus sp.]MBF0241569.1 zinc ribbon domain-containing protein [Desulfamplus sp.]MBF0388999.1 zinc ribbon domain-containing protein [Desulfamplus sp.]
MPIFEFKCSDCEEFFESLFMSKNDEKEIKCPKCSSFAVERVVSATNYVMGGSASSKNQSLGKQTRQCSSGSCTTYTVPGV